MGNSYFKIEYDHEIFHPGQVVSGQIVLRLDEPKELRGIELILSGEAKCQWYTRTRRRRDRQRRRFRNSWGRNSWGRDSWGRDSWGRDSWDRDSWDEWRLVYGKETLFETKRILLIVERGQKLELAIGEYMYPFSVPLPPALPSTYKGTYGGITYRGEVKMDVPWALDITKKRNFTVESLLNLNELPALNRSYRNEESKIFCCLCCASGPLVVTVEIPRTAYVFDESIPLMIEVDNASNVKVSAVKIELHQKIYWFSMDDTKFEDRKLKTLALGSVKKYGYQTWNEDFALGPHKYPQANCLVLRIKYELKIKFVVNGLHSNLTMRIPFTIGDIPYDGSAETTDQFPRFEPPLAGTQGDTQ